MSIKPLRYAKAEIAKRNDPKWRAGKDQRMYRALTSAEAFVLLMLADHYNDEWQRAWPSPATLCQETSLSSSTVKRSLKSLEELELIAAERWMLNDGAIWLANRYLLSQFAPNERPAFEQPVLAFAWYDDDLPAEFRRLPGSALVIDETALDPDGPSGTRPFTVNRVVGSL